MSLASTCLVLLPWLLGTLSARWPRCLCRAPRPLTSPAALTPPGWVFGVVWTLLYLLLGVVLLRLTGRGGAPGPVGVVDRVGLALFVGQLALNLAWTSVYRCASRQAAFFVLAAIVAATLSLAFWRAARDPVSAALLGPYLAWLLAAAHLNAIAVEVEEEGHKRDSTT